MAIALVIISHFQSDGNNLLTGAGPAGLRLFFVLSGYLITTVLVRQDRISLRWFYARRLRRLVPALVLFLAAMLLAFPVWQVVIAGSYGANWYLAAGGSLGNIGHLWSLAVEEQFYLVWPLVLAVLLRRGVDLPVVLVVVVALGVWRLTMFDGPLQRAYYGTETNAPALLAGAALALASWRPGRPFVVLALGVVVVAAVVPWDGWGSRPVVELLFWATIAASVVLVAGATRIRWIGVLAPLGVISYGLYLWHVPLMRSGLGPLVGMGLAIVIAALSFYLWERRWLPSPRDPDDDAARATAAGARVDDVVGSSATPVTTATVEAAVAAGADGVGR